MRDGLAALNDLPRLLEAGTLAGFQVLRGAIDKLPVGSDSSETCLGTTATPDLADSTTPDASGMGFCHLIRKFNSCGVGIWGFESEGDERTTDSSTPK